jgi:hypothetical protein
VQRKDVERPPIRETGALSGFEDASPFFQRQVLEYVPGA